MMLRPTFVLVLLGHTMALSEGSAQLVQSAREISAQQNRKFSVPASELRSARSGESGSQESSFGEQEILKQPERSRRLQSFAEVGAFVTDNVALSRHDRRGDAFLQATFGFSYRHEVTSNLSLQTDVQYAAYRYDRFGALDFDSLDTGLEANYRLERLGGLDLFARYNFNDLFDADGDSVFQNHTFAAGLQKQVTIGDAHTFYAGVSGQLAMSDPEFSERSEGWAYAGYRLQATQKLEAALAYRYGFFHYDEQDRSDHNHSVSLDLVYRFTDWLSAAANSYLGWNRSDQNVFNYDVANAGGALSLRWRF